MASDWAAFVSVLVKNGGTGIGRVSENCPLSSW
jgi:hypothetical protein